MWGWVLRRFGADGGETPGVELGVHVGPSGFAPAPSPGRATNASRLSWDLGAGGRRGRPSVRPASRAREPVEGKAGCGLRAQGPRLPLTLPVRVKETPSAAPTPRSPPGPDAWAPVPRPLEESRAVPPSSSLGDDLGFPVARARDGDPGDTPHPAPPPAACVPGTAGETEAQRHCIGPRVRGQAGQDPAPDPAGADTPLPREEGTRPALRRPRAPARPWRRELVPRGRGAAGGASFPA